MNCVYVKLSPYLGEYWYRRRNIPKGEPLTLPDAEYMNIICSSLRRNRELHRSLVRNAKGYLKDNVCYCKHAYDFTMSCDQPPLCFDDNKIPTKEECKSLFPFLIPDKICVGGKDVATDDYYELKPGSAKNPLRGCAGVRKYILVSFYDDLNRYLISQSGMYLRRGQSFSPRALISDFLNLYDIGENHIEYVRTNAYRLTDISRLDSLTKGCGDIDSIVRTYNSKKALGQLL